MKISSTHKNLERRGRSYHRWTEKSTLALLEWLTIPQNNRTFKRRFLANADSERSSQMYQAIRASSKCLRSCSNSDLKRQLLALHQTFNDLKTTKLHVQDISIEASALVHAFANDFPDEQADTECIVVSDSDEAESDADTLRETDPLDSTFVGPDERSWLASDFPNCPIVEQPDALAANCQTLVSVLQALADSQKEIAHIEKKKLAVELRAVELKEQREATRQARRCAKLMTKAAQGKP